MFKTVKIIDGRVKMVVESTTDDVTPKITSAAMDSFVFGLQSVIWTRDYQTAKIITKKCRYLWKHIKNGFFYIKYKNIYEFFQSVWFFLNDF